MFEKISVNPMVLERKQNMLLGEKLEKWRDIRNIIEYSPYIPADIITVYVSEKKESMWDLCVNIALSLRNQGIRAGLRTE